MANQSVQTRVKQELLRPTGTLVKLLVIHVGKYHLQGMPPFLEFGHTSTPRSDFRMSCSAASQLSDEISTSVKVVKGCDMII